MSQIADPSKFENKYYDIQTRVFNIDDPIVDPKLAAEGLALLIRSMGRSPVSEAVMIRGFDISIDGYRTQFKIRYVDYPGLYITVPDTTTTLYLHKECAKQ